MVVVVLINGYCMVNVCCMRNHQLHQTNNLIIGSFVIFSFHPGKYIYSASGSLDDPRKEDEGFKAITKDDDKKYAYVTLVGVAKNNM